MASTRAKTSFALVAIAVATVGFVVIRDRGTSQATDVPRSSSSPEQAAAAPGRAHRIEFKPAPLVPAGSPVPKYNPAVMEEINSTELRDSMPRLLKRAGRDPSVAYALALSLAQCAAADAAYEGLAASADQMGGPEKLEARLKEYEKTFGKCKGLRGKNLELRFDLATSAANAGLVDAQLLYRATGAEYVLSEEALRRPSVAQEYHRNAVNYINRAAATGNPDALMAAFGLYSDGMLIPPDKVAAYRYLRAYAQSNPAAQNLLLSYASRMSPDELRRANQ